MSSGNAGYYGAGSAAALASNANSCSIAPPPPCMEYCMPAPYAALYGQTYFSIGQAYGRAVARDCGCSGNTPAPGPYAPGPIINPIIGPASGPYAPGSVVNPMPNPFAPGPIISGPAGFTLPGQTL